MTSVRYCRRSGKARGRAIVRGAAIALVAVLAFPILLLAHAHLRRSEPAAAARLTVAPTAIRLWFSERPELAFTRIHLRGSDSTEVPLGAVAAAGGDDMGVAATISRPLAPGTYRVEWQTAGADGHPTRGSFVFTVIGTTSAATMAHDTAVSPPVDGHALVRMDTTERPVQRVSATAATHWLEFVAMLAAVGAVVFRLVVLRGLVGVTPGEALVETRLELSDAARRFGQSALVLLAITMLSRLYEEGRAVLGGDRAFDRSALRTILTGTSWGVGWLIGLAGVILAAVGFSMAKRFRTKAGWSVAALGSALIVLSQPVTGHAMATSPVPFSLVVDFLHVAAVCAWIGGLLTLLFTAMPFVRGTRTLQSLGTGPLVASLVRAFHPVALTCAAIVVASGLVSAWLRLPTVASLWSSTYGRVLLVKLCLVAVVVVLGAVNWRRMLPRLGDEAAARRITRTAGTELTIAMLVLAVTAVLVSTSPP